MRKKAVTKEELQRYAIKLIKKSGLEACTMRNLASISGVAVGTLYNYYPSRETLLNDVFSVSWKQTIKRLKQNAGADISPEDRIAEYCKTISEEINDRQGLGKEVITKNINLFAGTSPYHNLLDELTSILKDIIKDGENNGNLPDETLTMLSKWMLLAIISHIPNKKENEDIFISQLCIRFL